MAARHKTPRGRGDAWYFKLAALAPIVACVGIPINYVFEYTLLVAAVTLIFTGIVIVRPRAWLSTGDRNAVA